MSIEYHPNNINELVNKQHLSWRLSVTQRYGNDYLVVIPANTLFPDVIYNFELKIVNFQGIEFSQTFSLDTTGKEILLFELEGASEYHPTYVKKADDLIVRVIPIFHNCKVDMRGYDNVVVEFHEKTDKLPQKLYTDRKSVV